MSHPTFDNTVGKWASETITEYKDVTLKEVYFGAGGAFVRSSSMEPTRLAGQVAIAHNGTTVTGTSTEFVSQFVVGDIFHTGDENIVLEGDYGTEEILMEDDERLRSEDLQISEVQSDTIIELHGVTIDECYWHITNEDNDLPAFSVGTNVLGGFDLNTTDESFYLLGEDSNAELELGLEDGLGQLVMETADVDSPDLLLEDGEKVLLTEPGEFKVASITNDTSLVVTRKHWGGTDVVSFWKPTSRDQVIAFPPSASMSETFGHPGWSY
jgi:hypothetical protein